MHQSSPLLSKSLASAQRKYSVKAQSCTALLHFRNTYISSTNIPQNLKVVPSFLIKHLTHVCSFTIFTVSHCLVS